MSAGKIAVCSSGNPLSPSTWSGTPSNICRCLSDMDRLDVTLDSSAYARARLKKATDTLSRYYYLCTIDTERGRFHRYFRGRHINAFFKSRDSADVLHTGTLDLPLPAV